MNDKKTPTPAQLRAKAEPDQAALMERMSQPIDPGATYRIQGQALVQILAMIDEIPTKHGRLMLPAILTSIEREGEE